MKMFSPFAYAPGHAAGGAAGHAAAPAPARNDAGSDDALTAFAQADGEMQAQLDKCSAKG
jgi:hypothetical protein